MAVLKNNLPILEYDEDPLGLLRHDRCELVHFPERCVFAFLGDTTDHYARSQNAVVLDVFETVTGNLPIYEITYHNQSLCLCRAPLGGAAAAQLLDWLIGHGVRSVISAGSCGALTVLPENAFLIPEKALRDEGTSYHYLPPARYVSLDQQVITVIASVLSSHSLPYALCTTWSTDGFFRETKDMVSYRRDEGCSVVEMECASLAACAAFRGAAFGQLLFTADTLADSEKYDERGWGKDSRETALQLCLEIAAAL